MLAPRTVLCCDVLLGRARCISRGPSLRLIFLSVYLLFSSIGHFSFLSVVEAAAISRSGDLIRPLSCIFPLVSLLVGPRLSPHALFYSSLSWYSAMIRTC
jgi:hypothetical protein